MLIRQIITAGLIDRVAKRVPEVDSQGTSKVLCCIRLSLFENDAKYEYILYQESRAKTNGNICYVTPIKNVISIPLLFWHRFVPNMWFTMNSLRPTKST